MPYVFNPFTGNFDFTNAATAVAGATGQIQFNDAGALGASSNLFWDSTNSRLGLGTASPAVRLHVIPTAAAAQGLIVGSAASQTANIQEWRDASNNQLSAILATGEFRGRLSTVLSTNSIGHIIQASASQTANLTEWRSSAGTVLTRVSNTGAIVTTPGIISGGSFTGGSGGAASANIIVGQRWNLASSGTSGDFLIRNESLTGPVKIQFGGTTASSPSIENIGADLIIRSANATNATRVGIGAVSPAAMLDVTALSDATTTAIFRSASASAVNIVEWRDSANSTKMKINQNFVFFPVQATTAAAPAYVLGGMYFDTTLNKLRIGGATAWETVTST